MHDVAVRHEQRVVLHDLERDLAVRQELRVVLHYREDDLAVRQEIESCRGGRGRAVSQGHKGRAVEPLAEVLNRLKRPLLGVVADTVAHGHARADLDESSGLLEQDRLRRFQCLELDLVIFSLHLEFYRAAMAIALEVTEILRYGEAVANRPGMFARVFRIKLRVLYVKVLEERVLGTV